MDNFPVFVEKINKLITENTDLKNENTLLKTQMSQLEELFADKTLEWTVIEDHDAFTHASIERIKGITKCKERCIKMGYGGFTLADDLGHLLDHSPDACLKASVSTQTKEYHKINPGISTYKNVALYISPGASQKLINL